MTREEIESIIAKRTAKEFKDGDIVVLGIGIPMKIPDFLPNDVRLTIIIDSGIIDVEAETEEMNYPLYIIDADGNPAKVKSGGAFMDMADILALVRGGHINKAVLGALQVDSHGNLSNWTIPEKFTPGMGGAMDLSEVSNHIILAMEHTNKGMPKIMKENTLPLTAPKAVEMIITEMGVMKITSEGIMLTEYNPVFTLEEIQSATDADLIISKDLKPMNR